MTDFELTRLAFKAAFSGADLTEDKDMLRHWSPLTDDGDALRLAVKLKIHHRQYSNQVQIRGCWCRDGYIEASRKDIEEREPVGNDPYAATRRAIVRAAAEIGKTM